jgi:hypothetical protein
MIEIGIIVIIVIVIKKIGICLRTSKEKCKKNYKNTARISIRLSK